MSWNKSSDYNNMHGATIKQNSAKNMYTLKNGFKMFKKFSSIYRLLRIASIYPIQPNKYTCIR